MTIKIAKACVKCEIPRDSKCTLITQLGFKNKVNKIKLVKIELHMRMVSTISSLIASSRALTSGTETKYTLFYFATNSQDTRAFGLSSYASFLLHNYFKDPVFKRVLRRIVRQFLVRSRSN